MEHELLEGYDIHSPGLYSNSDNTSVVSSIRKPSSLGIKYLDVSLRQSRHSRHSKHFQDIELKRQPIYRPKKWPCWFRYMLLFLITSMNFAPYYVYDFPQALQTPFNELYGISPKANNLFYMASGLPNTVLTFFGGIIIVKIGEEAALVVCQSLIVIGHIIFSLGTLGNNYSVMMLGRVFLGIGSENNSVVQCCLVQKWFGGSYETIAFALVVVFNYSGSACTNYFTPALFTMYGNFYELIWVSYIVVAFGCIISTVIY